MWLLPPDFPADAFDLPPGTWALPWYADDEHISRLMQLLVLGEARLREWHPLPWEALDDVDMDAPVRPGAALVIHAPSTLRADEIVARARALPWPYVFWRPSHPVVEGEGAWLEREIKRVLLSELLRGLLDTEHPLARFNVARLPLDLIASMVADPVDLVEIAQAAVLHRLRCKEAGLRSEDFGQSVRWAAGQRLGDYLLRIPEAHRFDAMALGYLGRRGQTDRASFRQAAQAIQDVGLGLLVGEDLALGPLMRSASDDAVWESTSSWLAAHGLDTALLRRMSVPSLAERAPQTTPPSIPSTSLPLTEILKTPAVRTVWVDPTASRMAALILQLEQSPHLSLVDAQDAGYFHVAMQSEHLHVAGPSWLRRVPWPATPAGIQALVADLEALARADALLTALESPSRPEGLVCDVAVFMTKPGSTSPSPLRADEVVCEGARIYAEIRYRKRGPALYINVINRGVSGRMSLINHTEPAGVTLHALDTHWVGRRRHGNMLGMVLRWPEDVPKGGIGRESLIFVESNRPLDLRPMLEGPSKSSTRSDPWLKDNEDGTVPLSWAVSRVEFGVTATPHEE